jgi:thiol-disulfide isomerase/thioredoxin
MNFSGVAQSHIFPICIFWLLSNWTCKLNNIPWSLLPFGEVLMRVRIHFRMLAFAASLVLIALMFAAIDSDWASLDSTSRSNKIVRPDSDSFRQHLQLAAFPNQARGKKIAAAEFPPDAEWVNVKQPLKMSDFRGSFVLLDFWTYCCINCMHLLPVLEQVEEKYKNQLVVVGVHTAKFATERDTENIREAIFRYEINHPVLNDTQQQLWQYYGVNTWPTLVLIDPNGDAIWSSAGEIEFEDLDVVLRNAIKNYKTKLAPKPPQIELIPFDSPETPLRFPGKVLADEPNDRLFISDSNHNRIVVTDLQGKLKSIIGSGQIGRSDGSFQESEFNHPQGIALASKDILYVADTENHLIRKVDLAAEMVSTVAGTGVQSLAPWQGFPQNAPLPKRIIKKPRSIALASPWDLYVEKKMLWIAMAGAHQIWRMSLDDSAIGHYAGNGREDIVDGMRLPKKPYEETASSFAQPSGLATDGQVLFVADSEGSSIRTVPMIEDGLVETLLGTSGLTSNRLFTFGDRDGNRSQALLQHPLGVAYLDKKLFVADTYNNKVKWIDLETGQVRTLIGSGLSGKTDNPALLDEPSGLSIAGGKLYIADTNNHLIRVWDLEKSILSTLSIDGLTPPGEKPLKISNPFPKNAKRIPLENLTVATNATVAKFETQLMLPKSWKINAESPQGYIWQYQVNNKPIDEPRKQQIKPPTDKFSFELPLPKADSSKLQLAMTHYYCQTDDKGVCVAETVVFELNVERTPQGVEAPVVKIQHEIMPESN